jgi:hypothetical protein
VKGAKLSEQMDIKLSEAMGAKLSDMLVFIKLPSLIFSWKDTHLDYYFSPSLLK